MTEYKITFVEDRTNYIATNRKSKELLVSSDIKIDYTDDGNLCATFQNTEQSKPTIMDMVRDLCGKPYTPDNSDCSIIINDASLFHYCTRENGEYKLFGGGVTFKGTDRDDKLTMYECKNSTINLGDGNDTLKIEGAKTGGFLADFQNNRINMGEGNDNVSISGNFNKFTDNKINLGKGDDSFVAEINPEDDKNVTTASAYYKMETKYAQNVLGSEIQATEGKKGLFEKDLFESKTFSSNKFILSEFKQKNVICKTKPKKTSTIYKCNEKVASKEKRTNSEQQTNKTKQTATKLTYEEKHQQYEKSYQINAFLYYLTGKPEFAEKSIEAVKKAAELNVK